MNRFTLIFLVFSTITLQAQNNYSYISDKKFYAPNELIGYTFVPNILVYADKENPQDAEEIDLVAGEVSFFITESFLYVKGEEFEGSYSIVSINSVNYGFILKLINAQNPSIQGHLKIILNRLNQVDALIFKPSSQTKEVLFYQAIIPKMIEKEERAYFTDRSEVNITDSTLWKTTLFPFFEIGNGKQRRIQPNNKWEIRFSEDSVVTKKKTIINQYVELSFLEENEAGTLEPYNQRFQVEKVVERMNKSPKKVQDRYLLTFELKTKKVDRFLLYLDDDRKVNSVIIGDQKYLMRGF